MKLISTLKTEWGKVTSLNRSTKLFLFIPVFFGMYYAVKGLFFNFYILEMGFDKEYLGLANSVVPAATLVLAFPLGVLTDRIGRKRAVQYGMILLAVSYLVFLFVQNGTWILILLFINGIGESLYFVASTPLLTRLTTAENRIFVFSLRSALFTFAGVFGSYVGGQIPLFLESSFGIAPTTAASYQGVLFINFFLILFTLVPVAMIPAGDGQDRPESIAEAAQERGSVWQGLAKILRKKIVWQLFMPNLLIGMGAALMVPYLNIFLVEVFHISDQTLGLLFSIASLITGMGTMLAPWVANRLGGRIQALVFAQSASLFFLLVLGFSPWLGVAVIGLWGRNALMNMAQPLYNAFSMEQVSDREQGTLSSLLSLSWNAGWALMPSISGVIQEAYGFAPIFVITGILYAASTIMIWVSFKNAETQPQSVAVAS